MSNDLRIAISGKSGCGNSTVTRLLAKRLGLRVINYTFKDLARDKGMTFEEICRLAEVDTQYDIMLDRMQVELARDGQFVLGSRLAIWLLREVAFTVYLVAPLEVRARRIARREGLEIQEALDQTATRDERDHARYSRLYGYDVDDYSFASLILDADRLNQEQITDAIAQGVIAR